MPLPLAVLVMALLLAGVVLYVLLVYRLYRRLIRSLRGRGYKSPAALTLTVAGAVAIVVAGTMLLKQFVGAEDLLFPVAILVVLVPVPLILATRLIPTRDPRAPGPRSVQFPYRPAAYALFAAAAGVAVAGTVIGFNWPGFAVLLAIGGAACLRIARRSMLPDAPATLAADPRPPVLYLRPFAHEAEAFVEVPRTRLEFIRDWMGAVFRLESKRYLTLEGYLGPTITSEIGPFIALGNPLDVVPPEGAARIYAADEDWMQQFAQLGERAVCVIAAPVASDQLRWELQWMRERGLQGRLFVLTSPQLIPSPSSTRERARRWLVYLMTTSVGPPTPPDWQPFARTLHAAGYLPPDRVPGTGAVLSFDAAGHAVLVKSGCVTPADTVAALAERLASSRPRETGGDTPAPRCARPAS